ncbi:MAG: hypothetical protein ACRDTT_33710 [Pseudonocardiaceae bacterium]
MNSTRVARLMRQAGIQGLYRRRRRGCTVRDPDAVPSEDLVNRQFEVDRRSSSTVCCCSTWDS